jgi:hypothetical protein
MNYMQFPNGKIWPVHLDRLTAFVEVDLDDLHDFDVDGLVNILHELAIGAPALRNIEHTARHAKGRAVVFQVEAHVEWSAFAGASIPKEVAVHEVVQQYAAELGWGKAEATHALESWRGTVSFGGQWSRAKNADSWPMLVRANRSGGVRVDVLGFG